jgi:hypothetical protein
MSYTDFGNSLLWQLSSHLDDEELKKLIRCTANLSPQKQETMLLLLLFEIRSLCEPHIDDKMERFLYRLIKQETFNKSN